MARGHCYKERCGVKLGVDVFQPWQVGLCGYGHITAHAAFRSLSFSVLTVGYLEAVEEETSFTEIPVSTGILIFFTCLKLVL